MGAGPAPNLVASYLSAVYRVTDGRGHSHHFTFDPEGTHPGDDPRALPFAEPWAVVTAWNPCSGVRCESENCAAHERLIAAVHALNRRMHPTASWDAANPGAWREEGVLIERCTRALAGLLLRVFRQHAAVYCAGGCAGLLFADPAEWRVCPLRLLPGDGK